LTNPFEDEMNTDDTSLQITEDKLKQDQLDKELVSNDMRNGIGQEKVS